LLFVTSGVNIAALSSNAKNELAVTPVRDLIQYLCLFFIQVHTFLGHHKSCSNE
jgi:hypothetical protein